MIKSRFIKFTTAAFLLNEKVETLMDTLIQVNKLYRGRGFKITTILMDGQFQCLEGPLSKDDITLNICSNDEHVGEIERMIRTIKDRTRCIYTSLPFERMPGRLIVEMVYCCVFWLNCFYPSETVVEGSSPRTIMTGRTVDYNKQCTYEFGQYVQTHEEHNADMKPRTIGALALRPTGNEQGGYYFLSLLTGKRLNRAKATPLNMPAEVISRVHQLARRNPKGIEYRDRNNNIIPDIEDDDDDDSTYATDDDDTSTDEEDNDGDETSVDDTSLSNDNGPILNIDQQNRTVAGVIDRDTDSVPDTSVPPQQNEHIVQAEIADVPDESTGVHEDISITSAASESTGVPDDDNSKSTGVPDDTQSDLESTGVSFNEPNNTNTTKQIAELEEELDHQYGTKLTMDNSSDEEHDKQNETS